MKVQGFKAAGIAAELRYKDKLDLGVIVSETEAVAAGVYTKNLVKAAPVLWSREITASGRARAILVNSGQANACTGPDGPADAADSARVVAESLGCSPDEVLLASTGVIGERINMEALTRAVPVLKETLGDENLAQVAKAMMTTDTRVKILEAGGRLDDAPFRMVGMAKGSGMIAPNMATMLCFILTDAAVSPGYLQKLLARGAERSFNRITIDGDTSTNDCVLVLANGLAGNPPMENSQSPGAAEFERILFSMMKDLAKLLVQDGEGATKTVRVAVFGASDGEQAKLAAMTVANSPLVKTALFGQDANWGRLMMALGRSGAIFDPDRVGISLDNVPLVRAGQAAKKDNPEADHVMRLREYTINIDLGVGTGQAEILTSDFSFDYVKINADYRS